MSKNVIITGTSRGIGLELVKLFAAKGNNVLALSRNDKPIQQLNLNNVHAFSFDLGNQTDSVSEFLNISCFAPCTLRENNNAMFLFKSCLNLFNNRTSCSISIYPDRLEKDIYSFK